MNFLSKLFGGKKKDSEAILSLTEDTMRLMAVTRNYKGLTKALQHPDVEMRRKAIMFIGMAGKMSPDGENITYSQSALSHPQAVKLLTIALKDADPTVQEAAAEELEKANNDAATESVKRYRARVGGNNK